MFDQQKWNTVCLILILIYSSELSESISPYCVSIESIRWQCYCDYKKNSTLDRKLFESIVIFANKSYAIALVYLRVFSFVNWLNTRQVQKRGSWMMLTNDDGGESLSLWSRSITFFREIYQSYRIVLISSSKLTQ